MAEHHYVEGETEVLTPRESRQGFLGRPVLYVLLTSLALVLIAWAVVEVWY